MIDTDDFVYVPRLIVGVVGILITQLILIGGLLWNPNVWPYALAMVGVEFVLVVISLILIVQDTKNTADVFEILGLAVLIVAPVVNAVIISKTLQEMIKEGSDPFEVISFRHYFLYMIGKPIYFVTINPEDVLTKDMVKVSDVLSDGAIHVTASKKVYAAVLLKHSNCDGTIL